MTDQSSVPDYGSLLRLDGQSFLVLGAGQGIGRQTAHALASVGARTLCVDIDEARARQVAEEVGGIAWSGDITRRAGMEQLVSDALGEWGRIDGLVDIVGIAQWASLLEVDDETWDSQFDMSLRHGFLAMQLAGQAMVRTGGGVMAFVASTSGLHGAPRHGAYGAAKAGLIALVRTAALELGPHHVRVNAVAPGTTLTPRLEAAMSPDLRRKRERIAPFGRLGSPSEIASVLLFLVSGLSSNVNGQIVTVDGGVSVRDPWTFD